MFLQSIVGLKFWAQAMFHKFLRDEKGEVNIVAIVVLIGIAVILAIIFKDAIKSLIQSMLNTIGNKANNAIEQ